jgi:formamidopyrimidine-DNA glycosylase
VPELPEIEVLKRSLAPHLVGRRIGRVVVRAKALREPLDRRALARSSGRSILALRRRSKYLLIDLDGGATLVVHLGMSGRLTLVPASAAREPHEHLVFGLDRGGELRFRDPRRFGLVFLAPTATLEGDPHFARLGREPLSPRLDGAGLRVIAAGLKAPAKAFLLDAHRLVGVGNIYATEALFRAGVRPDRSIATLGPQRFERLAEAIVAVLEEAIVAGGTTLNDFADGEGNAGEFQIALSVYGREGEPCPRCGATIRRIVQSNRSSFYCGRCQR